MTQTPPNVLTGVFPENDALVLIGFEHEDIPYLDRVASIYDIRPREREYYNQLPDIQKPAFVNYVQGSRLLTGPKTLSASAQYSLCSRILESMMLIRYI